MNRILICVVFVAFFSNCFCQKQKVNEVALSSTFIWNNTTIFNSYSGARAKDISGNALSNGININYSKSIYRNFYGKIGIGYFKQKFGIVRPFDFRETVISTNLLYSTKYYQYKNFNYFIGFGYSKNLSNKYSVKISTIYSFLNSFKQEFNNGGYTSREFGNPQTRKEKYHFGNSLITQAGLFREVYKNYKIGVDLLLPVYNKWRKDEIFREDSNEFYGSNFSIGTSINLIYSFNKK